MKQYIDKAAAIAEIDKIIDESAPSHDPQCPWEDGYYCGLCRAESILDTLEVKKVDLEKEIDEYMKLYHLHIKDGGRIIFENDDTPNFMCDFYEIAKYFYELGLKARKEYIDKAIIAEIGNNSLEKFKSLQHITKDLHQTLEDWGYAPNLYQFDGSWHVDWISCEEGDSIKGFTAETPEEVIDKAYDWFHSTFCNS